MLRAVVAELALLESRRPASPSTSTSDVELSEPRSAPEVAESDRTARRSLIERLRAQLAPD